MVVRKLCANPSEQVAFQLAQIAHLLNINSNTTARCLKMFEQFSIQIGEDTLVNLASTLNDSVFFHLSSYLARFGSTELIVLMCSKKTRRTEKLIMLLQGRELTKLQLQQLMLLDQVCVIKLMQDFSIDHSQANEIVEWIAYQIRKNPSPEVIADFIPVISKLSRWIDKSLIHQIWNQDENCEDLPKQVYTRNHSNLTNSGRDY
jgi:GGDEF domain-containing protein